LRVLAGTHRVACHFAEELAGERRGALLSAGAEHSDVRDTTDADLVAVDAPAAPDPEDLRRDVVQR
jgi:hypothetical protein